MKRLTILDVVPHDGDPVVPVVAGLLMVEAQGVIDLVLDGAVAVQAPLRVVDALFASPHTHRTVAAIVVADPGKTKSSLDSPSLLIVYCVRGKGFNQNYCMSCWFLPLHL